MSPLLIRVVFGVVMAWFIHMGIFAKRGWLDWRRISGQSREMEGKIQAAKAQKEDLLRQAEALQSDAGQQERMVRQVLGYIRANETVIEFE